ncbi:hypothetical protein [Niveispirillum sp. BGYR6]|uniref:hypothetical protein n=1 Tax=Niveispirillum sp. BGYR6 TaxID=2971249 RepID=UPI0022B984F4|nr:hypothetical protein [Niveispirillum sp. BGYR6]MDG5496533.1 hypothetical protein [Niveispirillum sp. BGYR6]
MMLDQTMGMKMTNPVAVPISGNFVVSKSFSKGVSPFTATLDFSLNIPLGSDGKFDTSATVQFAANLGGSDNIGTISNTFTPSSPTWSYKSPTVSGFHIELSATYQAPTATASGSLVLNSFELFLGGSALWSLAPGSLYIDWDENGNITGYGAPQV